MLAVRSPAVRVTAVLIVALASAAAIGYLTTRMRNRPVAISDLDRRRDRLRPRAGGGLRHDATPAVVAVLVLLSYPVVVTLGYAGGGPRHGQAGMTPVLQVLVTGGGCGVGRRGARAAEPALATGGWPLAGIVCVVAFLLGAAYATIDISDVFRPPAAAHRDRIPGRACALTTLLRGGPPSAVPWLPAGWWSAT